MDTIPGPPVEPPAEPPAQPSRRKLWIAASAAGAAIVLGVGYIVLSKDEDTITGSTPGVGAGALLMNALETAADAPSASRRSLDHQSDVRGHWRQQAYGPNHSLRRPTWIDDHVRGPAAA
ncbi:MAG: hypothetical protein JWO77_3544 [Ilumatobacteraceae bacterium]|nr:hypothetical protein [Ilumatobacteraceae bacterium]